MKYKYDNDPGFIYFDDRPKLTYLHNQPPINNIVLVASIRESLENPLSFYTNEELISHVIKLYKLSNFVDGSVKSKLLLKLSDEEILDLVFKYKKGSNEMWLGSILRSLVNGK